MRVQLELGRNNTETVTPGLEVTKTQPRTPECIKPDMQAIIYDWNAAVEAVTSLRSHLPKNERVFYSDVLMYRIAM